MRPPATGNFAVRIDGWHYVLGRQIDKPITLGQEEILATDHQRAHSFADEASKGRLDLVRATCGENQKIRAKRSSRILYDPPFRRDLRSVSRALTRF
jgi:hypothetical protein